MIGGKNHHSVHEIPTTLFAECLGPAFDIFGLFPNSQNTLLYLEVIYHICYRHICNNFSYRHLCNNIFWNCYHLAMFGGLHLFFFYQNTVPWSKTKVVIQIMYFSMEGELVQLTVRVSGSYSKMENGLILDLMKNFQSPGRQW